MPNILPVLPGTFNERVSYDPSLLAPNQYWLQTDDGPPGSERGYYYWTGTQWQTGTQPNGGLLVMSGPTVLIQSLQANGFVALQGNGAGVQASDNVAGTALFSIDNPYPSGLRQAELRFKLAGAPNNALYAIFAEASTNPVTDQNLSFYDFINALTVFSLGRKAQVQFFTGLELRGILTPPQITADQNDYAPGPVQSYSVFRLSSDAARNLTGLAITPGLSNSGALVTLLNIGAFTLTLKTASGSSAPANRFALKADLPLAAGGGAVLWYDSASSVWRCLATY